MNKILVANRGEIALRILRSAKEMGIATVAVFSEADRNAPHVRFADEAVHLGPAPSKDSYLKTDKIIEVCKELGVDGIHPGYGFLSENPSFAKEVEDNNTRFIGPSSHSISIMGDKLASKDAVKQFETPLLPGTDEAITDIAKAKEIAEDIGFPILIKASAGGGGKGMRIVHSQEEFEDQMRRAVSEAESSFGDGSVFIEKYVGSPRHIEVQVLGDQHGNYVHLFERECSIQRRHQKVIEEAPSVIVDEDLRAKMGEAAINVARSCNYVGAGTVEFLMDEEKNFYFLEMNTRLQVEHPVTEMITGKDLVKEQIRIADGQTLSFSQHELTINGHAVELRVYAEDPSNNFLPDIGKLVRYRRPQGPGIRVDDGFEEQMEIPIHYDPMIAKLVTFGGNRQEAINRMVRAVDEYTVSGVTTTLGFGRFVMQHPKFTSGDFDTHFIQNHFNPEDLVTEDDAEAAFAAVLASMLYQKQSASRQSSQVHADQNGQSSASRWKMNRM
jgi:acetyl-CoA carboxylase biotin carboxylase subunit